MCIEENDNIPDNAASNADANFRYVTRTKKREQDWKTLQCVYVSHFPIHKLIFFK